MNRQSRSMILPRLANEAVDGSDEAHKSIMTAAVKRKVEELFDILSIDYRNDHNTRETPERFAKMFVEEILRGRYTAPPEITEFDNVACYDHLIITGPIELRSTCAHHLMPIYGDAFIGILPAPGGRIIGLSKYDRVVEYFSARLQIQEELVTQIAKHISELTKPRGLAVRISAVHMCKTHRGVRSTHRSRMITTSYYGEILDKPALKNEFLQECLALDRKRG